MSSYGQFCPVAKAMEILDERWTILIVREMLAGSTHFNEIRRGVPKMSPALLSKRLRSLQRAGVLERTADRPFPTYVLTPAGQALLDVVAALGTWGLRWVGELGEEDLDPHLLMWDMRRTVPVESWPRSRTVLAFEFDDVDAPESRWWFVVSGNDVDVCDVDPGYEVTARVTTSLHTLIRLWRAEDSWEAAQRSGRLALHGPTEIRRDLPEGFGVMSLARMAPA